MHEGRTRKLESSTFLVHIHHEESQCVGVHGGFFTKDTTTVCERASHSQPEQEGNQNEQISTLDLLINTGK